MTKAVSGTILGLATVLSCWASLRGQEPKAEEPARPSPDAKNDGGAAAKAVERLVGQIKSQTPERSKAAEPHGLYVIDAKGGTARLVAEEPEPGLNHCGTPSWSRDGRRIFFDLTPGTDWVRTHLMSAEAVEGRLKVTNLGPGNCPALSPGGKRIAFMLNSGAIADAEAGVWIMNADGTGRRNLGGYGRPTWSPDGRKLLVAGFGNPCEMSLMDPETAEEHPLIVPGHQVYTMPSWAGPDTLVASLGAEFGDTIALLDVSDPEMGRVKEVLWKKGDEPDVNPTYPVYSPASRRLAFAGIEPKGAAVYAMKVEPGKPGTPKRLEAEGLDPLITDLAFSPDGRFILFCTNRPEPEAKK